MMNVSIDSTHVPVAQPTVANPFTAAEREHLAREAVDFARKEVAEGLQCERESFRLASEANKRAARAWTVVQAKEEALAQGEQLTPEERAALEQELESARQEAESEQREARAAEGLASEWQQWRAGAEERLERAQLDANQLLKSLGKPEEFQVSKPVHDTFISQADERLREMAALLGAPRPLPPRRGASLDSRRIAVATGANPANGAQLLAQLLADREDPVYRQTLVEDALGDASRMGGALSELLAWPEGEDEAFAHDVACSLLEGLSRAAQALGAANAWPLVEAFARGCDDGDPGGRMAAWLEEVLSRGPTDLTFAVELAAALHTCGKTAAANEVVTAVHRALAQVRELFVQLSAEADSLDAALTAQLPELVSGRRATELEETLQSFQQEHYEAFETREEAAGALAATLDGAALAMRFAEAGGLPGGENTGRLLQEAILALGLLDRLLRTTRGQRRLGEALDARATDDRNFLEAVGAAARVLAAFHAESPAVLAQAGLVPEAFASGGEGFLDGVREGFARLILPQLLALRSNGKVAEAMGLLWTAVAKNPALFGPGDAEAANACRALIAIAHAPKPFDLRRALGMLQRLRAGDRRGDAVRGLGVAVALSNLTVTPASQLRAFIETLRICSRNLELGRSALRVLCCAFSPLCPTPAVAKLLGAANAAGAQDALGGNAAKVVDAFGAVLGVLGSPPEPSAFGKPLAPAAPLPPQLAAMLPVVASPDRVMVLVARFVRGLEGAGAARPVTQLKAVSAA